jgi:hypothetical protein
VPLPEDYRPLLAFLVSLISDKAWFRDTVYDAISRTATDPHELRWCGYIALYCLHTNVLNHQTDPDKLTAALDDLRVLFRLGPSDAQLVSTLWDIDYADLQRADRPPSFG